MIIGGPEELAGYELLAADPAVLWKGRKWYNTTDNLLKHYNGSATVIVPSSTTGVIAITQGGTGQTTATAAFNALAPTTTRGDLITRDASNNVRLGVGAANTVLKSDGTDPSYGQIVNANIDAAAGIVDTKLATISTALKVSNSATTATDANTANAIVARDASGDFSARVITATSSFQGNVNGNVTGTALNVTGIVLPDHGGTGIANNAAATTTRSGNFAKTETLTGVTSITYPTAGTLATLAGTEIFSNKTLDKLSVNVVNDGATGSAQTLSAITASLTRLTSGTLVSVAGIPQPSPLNQVVLILENRTGVVVSILNENAGAAASDRIITGTGADVALANNSSLTFVYDGTSTRWQVVGGSGSGTTITANRAAVSDGSGNLIASTTTAAEILFVNGVTSAIQTQLNNIRAPNSIVSISSNTSLTDHAIHEVNTTVARSLTFVQSATGYYEVKDITGSANTNAITITPTTGLIDGVASATVNSDFGSLRIYSNGTNAYLL